MTPHITICLTSISSRVDLLAQTIRSLLAQDHASFSVRLYLSTEPYLLDQGVSVIPEDLLSLEQAHDNFEINFVANIGSYRKLLPFLAEHWGQNQLVVTADDDTIYPDNWLAGLYAHYLKYRCVICYRGHFMSRHGNQFERYRKWMNHGIECNPDIYNLPTGKDGVLYNTLFFHPAVLNVSAALAVAPTADDLWLKWHAAAVGIPAYCINLDYSDMSFVTTNNDDGLYESFNRGGHNDETVQRLMDYAERDINFDFTRFNYYDLYRQL